MLMTLDAMLLEKLHEWKPGRGRQTLNLTDAASGWTVSLAADRCDELGCLVWELNLRRTSPLAGGDAKTLQAWGERAARRATGLMEALKLIEVDAQRDEAIVRSATPTQKNNDRLYYEALLTGSGTVRFRRYRGSVDGAVRDQVAFALTHEALAKLAVDLTADK
jgi:hypothetical protein